jgi:hypothetical protein
MGALSTIPRHGTVCRACAPVSTCMWDCPPAVPARVLPQASSWDCRLFSMQGFFSATSVRDAIWESGQQIALCKIQLTRSIFFIAPYSSFLLWRINCFQQHSRMNISIYEPFSLSCYPWEKHNISCNLRGSLRRWLT